MKRFALVLILLSSTALAQPAMVASPAYQECTSLAASNPAAALAKADEWLKIDQSIAPQHCRAMALFGLRRFEEAALALTQVRNAIGPENLPLRMYVAHQVAKAWAAAGKPEGALGSLSSQITYLAAIKGNNVLTGQLSSELLLGRAQLNVNYGKLNDAASDLDHAVSLTPLNPDVLLARAHVFEQLGDIPLARQDAQYVLKLRPGDTKAQALLNRTQPKAAPALAPMPALAPITQAPAPAATLQPASFTPFESPAVEELNAAPVLPVTESATP